MVSLLFTLHLKEEIFTLRTLILRTLTLRTLFWSLDAQQFRPVCLVYNDYTLNYE